MSWRFAISGRRDSSRFSHLGRTRISEHSGRQPMSNTLSYQGCTAHVESDAEDQILHGRVEGIRDSVTFEGATVDGLIADFHAAVDHYLAVCRQRGEAPQQPHLGRLLLRLDPAIHAAVARQAEAEGKSLSAWATEVLKRAANADGASR